MKHKLTLGFSPCPNDTFIFDALVNGRIDLGDIELEVVLADVEELNRMAIAGKLDITKISYNAFARVHYMYQLLNAGSALGNKCGPLLIAKKPLTVDELQTVTIAIPGKNTTANFLMSFAYPDASNKKEFLFSEIEKAVLNDEVEAGVIIHENRFTYSEKGLVKIADLGEVWEQKTGFPIPLGGIAIHRRLKPELRRRFDALLRESVQFAFNNPEASKDYVKCHAQEMDEAVMRSHINLYVNKYSIDLGEKGKSAIAKMYEVGKTFGMPRVEDSVFV
ncbi:MAG: 1,4-dihydroxy-6-naphthoate synthase [Flavobacteriales bacterium]|jgi:1,4-dihydroxy-6-naphthoate synthase|nr:1,4-dihydroxy-6-naphthoate synthase [Flavobacteriales bacterium]